MKRVVFGKSRLPSLSMAEVGAVYAFNKSNIDAKLREALTEASGVDSGVLSELASMFSRTLSLLDKKSEQLREQVDRDRELQGSPVQSAHARNVGDTDLITELSNEPEAPVCLRSVHMMRGDWLSEWSGLEKKYDRSSSRSGWITRCHSAVQAYSDATARTPSPGASGRDSASALALSHRGGPVEVADTLRMRASAFGKLAKLTDSLLRTFESSAEGSASTLTELRNTVGDDQQLADQVVTALVSGIQLGDSFCRDRLLRLADLAGKYPTAAAQLLDRLANIPAWVFLRYAPQLMGHLDLPSGEVAAAILERVAKVRLDDTILFLSFIFWCMSHRALTSIF